MGMKYCSYCGKEIMDATVVCPHCGCPSNGSTINLTPDVSNTGLNIISFLLPFVGLILYIIFHEKSPVKASAIGKWALIGLVVEIVLQSISLMWLII